MNGIREKDMSRTVENILRNLVRKEARENTNQIAEFPMTEPLSKRITLQHLTIEPLE